MDLLSRLNISNINVDPVDLYMLSKSTDGFNRTYGFRHSKEISKLTLLTFPYHTMSLKYIFDRWFSWLWLHDDLSITSPDISAECLAVLDDNTEVKPGIAKLLRRNVIWIKNVLSTSNYNRFKEYLRLYLTSNHDCNSADRYIILRRYDSACETVWPLLWPDQDINYQEKENNCRLATFVASITNDIYSYNREVKNGELFNYLQYVSLDKAIDEIVNAYNKITVKDIFDQRLILWLRGNIIWHSQADRYKIYN